MLVAITGANGFLGNYLSIFLENNGLEVRRIHRKNNESGFFIKEINKHTNWNKALENVDVLVHSAATVHVFENNELSKTTFYSFNVEATKNLAKQALKLGVKRFIFISTIKVFGEKTNIDSKFSLNSPLSPNDYYAKSKLEAEKALKKITSNTDMELIVIRPPLIYGPKVGANFLKMLRLINKGYPMPFGKIRNKRSIIYIGNISDFILNCIKHNDKNIDGKIFLPTDGTSLSTPELINKIAVAMNKKVLIMNIPKYILKISSFTIRKKRVMDKLINSLDIDSRESHKYINWEPPFSTEEGLKITTKWFSNNHNN